ncbi:Uma2 family endonuclease [Leptolyngbyaceae cyanobacterium UHCC 1019]
MVQTKTRFKNFVEYAAANPSELPEGNYELVNGEIVEMGAENDKNIQIAGFLFFMLAQVVPHYLIRRGTEIAVPSRLVTSRYPDLMVLTEETRAAMKRDQRSLISLEMPAPQLTVEVVSPGNLGSDNYNRDYIEKSQEYASRGILEYWLIDPAREVFVLHLLSHGQYQRTEFRGNQRIESPAFASLQLTAEQILQAGDP